MAGPARREPEQSTAKAGQARPAPAQAEAGAGQVRAAPRAPEPPLSVAPAPKPAPVLTPEPVLAQAAPGVAEAPASAQPRITLAELAPARWIELFLQLPLNGVARNIAANCALQDVSGNRLALVLEEGKATLYNDEHRKRIEAVLSDYFAAKVNLRVEVGAVAMETPSAWRARREAERKEAARKTFVEDPLVRAVVERFGAEIQYDSITSLNPDKLH